jgi:hypothetical protein
MIVFKDAVTATENTQMKICCRRASGHGQKRRTSEIKDVLPALLGYFCHTKKIICSVADGGF